MKTESLSELSNEQLIKKSKNLKADKIVDAFIVGITIGIFVYGAIQSGFGFFTFFPLIIGYLIVKNSANKKMLEQEIWKEIKARNLSVKD